MIARFIDRLRSAVIPPVNPPEHRSAALAVLVSAVAGPKLPTSSPVNYLGHGRQTWFAYLRSLRKAHADACSFVLAFDEVKNGRYQLEIVAALYSELSHPMIVGAPPAAIRWPRPLPLDVGAANPKSLQSCTWVSPAAQVLLGLRGGPFSESSVAAKLDVWRTQMASAIGDHSGVDAVQWQAAIDAPCANVSKLQGNLSLMMSRLITE